MTYEDDTRAEVGALRDALRSATRGAEVLAKECDRLRVECERYAGHLKALLPHVRDSVPEKMEAIRILAKARVAP